MQKEEYEWFTKMSYSQKQNHIKRVLSFLLNSKPSAVPKSSAFGSVLNSIASASISLESTKPCCSRQLFQDTTVKELSVKVARFADLVLILPRPVINAIWAKFSMSQMQFAYLQETTIKIVQLKVFLVYILI